MIVRLFNFSKKARSTKRPTIPADTDPTNLYEGITVDPMDILNPVLKFDLGAPSNAPTFNYAYIKELGQRLYFITKWVFDNGFWIASMQCDELGSWKTQIGSTTQFVTRSNNSYGQSLPDSYAIKMKSVSTTPSIENVLYDADLTSDEWTWHKFKYNNHATDNYIYQFIILINQTDCTLSSGTSIEYPGYVPYLCNWEQLSYIINYFNSNTGNFGLEDFNKTIGGVYYTPLRIPADYMVNAHKATLINCIYTNTVELPDHSVTRIRPQFVFDQVTPGSPSTRPINLNHINTKWFVKNIWLPQRSASQGNEQWQYVDGREVYLQGALIGKVRLDNSLIADKRFLSFKFYVDWQAGTLSIHYNTAYYTSQLDDAYQHLATVNFLAPVPVATSGIGDPVAAKLAASTANLQELTSLIGVVGSVAASVATGNPLPAVMSATSMASRVGSSMNTIHAINKITTSQFTGFGDLTSGEIGMSVYIVDNTYTEYSEYEDYIGIPTCLKLKISDISGFIQCEHPIFETTNNNMLISEAIEIKESMSNGFFYE